MSERREELTWAGLLAGVLVLAAGAAWFDDHDPVTIRWPGLGRPRHREEVEVDAAGNDGHPLGGQAETEELERLVAVLMRGGKATLRGVLCSGGDEWRFTPAPKRRTG